MKNIKFRKSLINSLSRQKKLVNDKYKQRLGTTKELSEVNLISEEFSLRNELISLGYETDILLSDIAEITLKAHQMRQETSSIENKYRGSINKFKSEIEALRSNKEDNNSQSFSIPLVFEEVDNKFSLNENLINDFKSNVFVNPKRSTLSELGSYGFYEPIRESGEVIYLNNTSSKANSELNKKIKTLMGFEDKNTFVEFIGKDIRRIEYSKFIFKKNFCQCHSNAILIETPNYGVEIEKLYINSELIDSNTYTVKNSKKGISIFLQERYELNSVKVVLKSFNKIDVDYFLNENNSIEREINQIASMHSNSWGTPWRVLGNLFFINVKNIKAFRQTPEEVIGLSISKRIDQPINSLALEANKQGFVDAHMSLSFYKDNELVETISTTMNLLEKGTGQYIERLIGKQVNNKNILLIAGKPSENLPLNLSIEGEFSTSVIYNQLVGDVWFKRIKDQYMLEIDSNTPINEEYSITYNSDDFNRQAIVISENVLLDNEGRIQVNLDHDYVIVQVNIFIRNSRFINSYLSEVQIVGN